MSKLTDDLIGQYWRQANQRDDSWMPFIHVRFARAIEAAATEPLLQRIAELEKENERLHRQNTVLFDEKLKAESEAKELFNFFVKRDKKITKLEYQLEEAKKQINKLEEAHESTIYLYSLPK